ncbi:MAG: hypothetical protein HON53_09160 [Planctomycetaceae bacterium]|nr:hypothetical protein [Planctomycetaceae bacterium]MBT6153163.1 hypothetical protein [Planctomycetaceae bacterium]MBT6485865.1 hypothetical protein [Planctomycetaceae bacterium]MBT6493428.1 hypothetical protein [Planctomycetaceae bacterium]
MARYFRYVPLLTIVLLFVALAFVHSSADDTRRKQKIESDALVPLLSSALDGPTFIVKFKNRGNEAVQVGQLKAESVCVLDGKELPCRIVKAAGRASVGPNETRELIVTLSHYLGSVERSGYSEKLQRWRWKSNLASGRHTVSFRFGGQELAPLSFFWDAGTPMLFE